jgi:hypothetical protein
VDGDATIVLVELADAEDACLQLCDVVHPDEGAVLAAHTDDDDVASALNLRDGAITKLHLAADMGVELGEEVPGASHVVGGARFQDPALVVMLLRWSNVTEPPQK